ncbi:hypothetical protein ACFX13_044009 [Malus domestica]
MDPCPFMRVIVGNLALKIPVVSKPARSIVYPSSSPCLCKIKLNILNLPPQNAVVPCLSSDTQTLDNPATAFTFHLSKSDLDRLASKSIFSSKLYLKISIYTGRKGTTYGVYSHMLLGRVSVPLNLAGTESKPIVFHNR